MTRPETKKKKPTGSGSVTVSQHLVPPQSVVADDKAQQLLAQQQRCEELEQKSLHLSQELQAQEQDSARLKEQLHEAEAQLREQAAELKALRETYQCVGPGTVNLANRFAALKQRVPWLLSPLTTLVRSL